MTADNPLHGNRRFLQMHLPRPAYKLLENHASPLGKLFRQTQQLVRLTEKLQSFLEPPLNQHCTVANFDHVTLVLHADSAAWASRLRYNTSAILSHMRRESDLQGLKTLRIKIKPADIPTQKSIRRITLTRTSARIITHSASLMPDDELRQSLLRLARHVNV